MTTPARAEDLIAITDRLAALLEHDAMALRGKRPADLATNENERVALTLSYTKAMAEFRDKLAIAALPLPLQKRLKQATERLHKALGEQARLLARFRHVTEGLVKAIAETVAARNTTGVYGKVGQLVKPPASPRAAALTLNQAV